MVYRRNLGRLGHSFQPTVQSMTRGACVGGVNSLDSLIAMPHEDCVYTFNLMPVEFGLQMRKGYREWGTGATDGLGGHDVRTVLAYESNTDAYDDKLWGVTPQGIYDFSSFGETSPTKDVTFTNPADPAGYGTYIEYTNDAGTHYLFYADYVNGIHQYTDDGGWTQPVSGTGAGEWSYNPDGGGLQGFPVDDVAFVMVHKQRIWVILENSDDAWYLPVASVAGELKKFTFGAKMTHGGFLLGLWEWTIDGGDGMDDYLIAVSQAGDVIVYRGGDPTNVDPTAGEPWQQVGSWYVGQCPVSRRIVTQYAAELYILSSYGITSIRDLLSGAAANNLRQSPSAKIARTLRADVADNIDKYEWAMNVHPGDGFMQVVTPEPVNTEFVQYNQNLSTKAWGYWEGVPMICGATWKGDYYMGGTDGVLYIYDGVLDGTTLAAPTTSGSSIDFRILTSFVAPQNHTTFKRAGFVRTVGLIGGTMNYSTEVIYDYAVETELRAPSPTITSSSNIWDSAVWDTDTWGYSSAGESLTDGILGMGRTMAIAMRGSTNARNNIIAWDITFTRGGIL